MKKKVRVYGFGGTPELKCGGTVKSKMQAGGPVRETQDSTDDNVPQQKNANFVDWLRNTTEASLFKQNLEQQQNLIRGIAQDGYSMTQTNIPEHLDWSRNLKPGAITQDYGKKKDPNASFWAASMERNDPNWSDPLNTMGNMVAQVFSKPEKWELDLKKGQTQQDLFKNFEQEGYGIPQLSTLDITGVKRKGNDRTLTYKATGKQDYLDLPADPNAKTYYGQPQVKETANNSFSHPGDNLPGYSTHGQMNFVNDLNNQVTEQDANNYFQFPSFDGSPFNIRKDAVDPTWAEKNPELIKMLGNFAMGGHLPKAQYGNFPDLSAYVTQSQDYNMLNQFPQEADPATAGTSHGMMDFLHNMNSQVAQNTGAPVPEYDPRGQQQDPYGNRNISEEGEIDLRKVSRWDQAQETNPYLASQSMIAGMQLLGNIGNLDERAAQEANIRERVSNVHRLYGTQGADRGDYMYNTPGIGDFLKPDQHTRMGYNTKIAQMGHEINSELDLSNEEIQKLIEQGYDLEFLD